MTTQTAPGVRLTRIFNATPARVYAAWTDPNVFAKWWGAGSAYRAEGIRMDVRPGGSFRVGMQHITKPASNSTVGTYTVVEPGKKLAFTWNWEQRPENGQSLVTLEFKDHPRGCEMVLTHDGFKDAEIAAQHDKGWVGCLALLRQRIFPDFNLQIRGAAQQFHAHQWMVIAACEGFDDISARKEAGQANCAAWVLAHMTNSRQNLLKMLGDAVEPQFSELAGFKMPHADPAKFPKWDDLRGAWALTEAPLIEALTRATDATLAPPAPGPFPEPNTVANAIAFLATHEAYHIGQLAFARRALGMAHMPLMP